MTMRRAPGVLALSVLLAIAGCGGSPSPASHSPTPSAGRTGPKVSAGTVLPEALKFARCSPTEAGTWAAAGVLINPTDKTLSFDISIHIGPADGKPGPAYVKRIDDAAPGKKITWSVPSVPAASPAGPCQIRVQVGKETKAS